MSGSDWSPSARFDIRELFEQQAVKDAVASRKEAEAAILILAHQLRQVRAVVVEKLDRAARAGKPFRDIKDILDHMDYLAAVARAEKAGGKIA